MTEPVRITSASNPIIKEIRSLSDKKGRKNSNAFLLEGFKVVTEALESGIEIRYFVLSESYYKDNRPPYPAFPHKTGLPEPRVIIVPDELFDRISETRSPQGIMAAAKLPSVGLDSAAGAFKRVIALENLQDPGNVGTIIRTADACGFDAVLLSGESADPYNPKVVRSTMGSLFHLPVIVVEDIYAVLAKLRTRGLRIAAAHLRNAVPCWEAELYDNIVLVIGNEGNGITDRLLKMSDFSVIIPMAGKTESLNASAAASILMYESLRQYRSRHT